MSATTPRLEKFYSRLNIEEADIILHFGMDSAECIDLLCSRAKKRARIIIFEPDEILRPRSGGGLSNASSDPRLQFVTGPSVADFFGNWGLGVYDDTDRFLWIESPELSPRDLMTAESLKKQFQSHLRDRAANLLTHFRNGQKYFENTISNFDFQSDANAGELFGRFANVPLVIVAAGPSLDRTIGHLVGFEDRCFILSVDTALRPLRAAGITPHAVIAADPSEMNACHIAGIVPESTYLIAEQALHVTALRSAHRRFLFGLGLFPDPLFGKFRFGKSRLDGWGSVATTALDLACRIGANPIIFTGQDFAYTGSREYARNTIYDGNHFDVRESGKVQTIDIDGREIYTTENLIAYRDYFVRRMKQSPRVRFINATEGGILTAVAEILPLQNALAQCAAVRVDVPRRLVECNAPSRVMPDCLRHFYEVLKYRRKDCGCLAGFLELTAKEHLMTNNAAEIENRIVWGMKCLQSRQ